ncbi:MAG: hypothetical protein HC874_27340 [Richelia sp. SL_2_1]|nr:hypothetical protein [Richelia sp. SL_2_1]
MADSSAQAEIRGIDIDKLAKGFADEENLFKNYVTVVTTSAREIRWYQKTAGFVDTPTTTAITSTLISNTASKALAPVAEQSWTRKTNYVQKFMVESPLLSEEDIMDSDVDVLATNVRDLVRSVARKVDKRIYDVITESLSPSTINTAAATGTGWDDATNGNPILDILAGKKAIRNYGYNPDEGILVINPHEEQMLLNWLITTKGSSIPQYSSSKVESGTVMEILGLKVVVSANATTDYAVIWLPSRSATWKTFMPITSAVQTDPGIGRKIRVWEMGDCLLTDPRSVHLITDTTT